MDWEFIWLYMFLLLVVICSYIHISLSLYIYLYIYIIYTFIYIIYITHFSASSSSFLSSSSCKLIRIFLRAGTQARSISCAQARSITNHCCVIGRNMYNKPLFCDMFSEFLDSCLCSFHRYLCVRETSSPGPYGLRGL